MTRKQYLLELRKSHILSLENHEPTATAVSTPHYNLRKKGNNSLHSLLIKPTFFEESEPNEVYTNAKNSNM